MKHLLNCSFRWSINPNCKVERLDGPEKGTVLAWLDVIFFHEPQERLPQVSALGRLATRLMVCCGICFGIAQLPYDLKQGCRQETKIY